MISFKDEYCSSRPTFSSQNSTSLGDCGPIEYSFLNDVYYEFYIFVSNYDEFCVFILILFDLLSVLLDADRPLYPVNIIPWSCYSPCSYFFLCINC